MDRVKGGRQAKGRTGLACVLVTALICLPQTALSAVLGSGLTEPSTAAQVKFRSVGLADAKWTHGFWANRLETCRVNTLPSLGRIMLDADPNNPGPSQYLQNFRVAAGAAEGRHRGASFNDGDLYKWLEAVAAVYAVTKDTQLDRTMDEAINAIAQVQRNDGYLQTDVIIAQRQGDKAIQPFTVPTKFEAYNLGHLLTAACVHYRATGKNSLLDVARKAANYFDSLVEHPTPQLARCAICPSHYMGMIELYRATGDTRYLNLAKRLIDLRDLVPDGTDDNQDRIPFRRQREAVGHAVRANYLYAGVADVYAETGEPALLTALTSIWDDVAHKKMYVCGACGALFDGASPDGSNDQRQISRVHQAYGRDYQLPNSTAHNETCAAVGNVLWNWRMLEITGDAKYADMLELTLCNAVLAGQSLDGKTFFYTNTLRQLDTMPVNLRWSRTRQGYFSSFCCPPNLARTIAEVSNYAYCKTDRGIAVNLYGSNSLETTVNGEKLRLKQETDYPWDGTVKITVEAAPKDACTIALRIPGWAKEPAISVADKPVNDPLQPGTYFEISRAWTPGDVIELKLPMPARLIEANPLVEETRNQVAVQRGPLVYCLESNDLRDAAKVSDVWILRNAKWQSRFEPKLLGGVAVLGCTSAVAPPAKWTGELYRELTPEKVTPVEITLIPYFAWSNRGKSEMSVWLPVAR